MFQRLKTAIVGDSGSPSGQIEQSYSEGKWHTFEQATADVLRDLQSFQDSQESAHAKDESPGSSEGITDRLLELANQAGSQADDPELDQATQKLFLECKARLESKAAIELIKVGKTAQKGLEIGAKAIQVLEKSRHLEDNLEAILDLLNHAAIFWTYCQDPTRALKFLTQAEHNYQQFTGSSTGTSASDNDSQLTPEDDSPSSIGADVRPGVTMKYAQTLYLLAQTHADLGHKELAVEYCAQNLSMLVKSGKQNTVQWIAGCEQLAGYYMTGQSAGSIALAQYLLTCASMTIQRSKIELESNRKASQEELPAVEAGIALTWAKLYSKRLHMSAHPDEFDDTPGKLPDIFRSFMPKEGEKEAAEIDWTGGKAKTEASAKELYNCGIRQLRKALEFFTVDEYPVQHVNITLEISEITRWLADFVADTHTKCVLHKQRAKRVAPLLTQIDKDKYQEAYNTIHLDIANAYKEITEIKFEESREPSKVAASAKEAIPHYEAFIDTYRVRGSLPDSIEDTDKAEMFVNAAFFLARMYSRLDPPLHAGNYTHTEGLRKAVSLYQYCAKFIDRNNLTSQKNLAQSCRQMSQLIVENAEMMRVTNQRMQKQAGKG